MRYKFAAVFIAFSLVTTVNAAVNVTIRQVGSDVVADASGSLNLTGGLGSESSDPTGSGLMARSASGYYYGAGSGAHSKRPVTGGWLTEQQLYTTNLVHSSSSSTGDFVGVSYASGIAHIQYPNAYNSGDPMSGSSTWLGQTINSLGLVPGTYTFDYGTDRVNFLVIDPSPASVPTQSPIGLMITVGAVALSTLHRRRKMR